MNYYNQIQYLVLYNTYTYVHYKVIIKIVVLMQV